MTRTEPIVLDIRSIAAGGEGVARDADGRVVSLCEADPEAVESGREVAVAAGAEVEFLAERVEDRIRDLLPADVIVVNPPRRGLAREVTEVLADARATGIAYVSCDPATLARDVSRLGERWRVRSVTPFDAFPQTAHVEVIAWLERT
ncbi:MAG: hypothetical protein ACE5HF_05715 [Gemmatimonadota bacterium]